MTANGLCPEIEFKLEDRALQFKSSVHVGLDYPEQLRHFGRLFMTLANEIEAFRENDQEEYEEDQDD